MAMSKVISAKNEFRVWVKGFLAKNTLFGPFEGDLTRLIQRVQVLETPPTKFEDSEWRESVTEHNALQGDVTWMYRVNPARCDEEQNMEAIRTQHDQIVFRTTQEISFGEELRVWLDPSLEREHGICHAEEEFQVHQGICQHCQESYQFSRALAVHTVFGCRLFTSGKIKNHNLADIKVSSECNCSSLTAPKDMEPVEVKRISSNSETKGNKEEEIGNELKDPTKRQSQFPFLDDNFPKINLRYSAASGHSRILSNPKLFRLISSFPRPRLRKFIGANEPESLAEYHKQEFRKKFQGNEHYLRRHLYRENVQKKGSASSYQGANKEVSQYPLQSFEEYHIKEEKEEFINCLSEDCTLPRAFTTHDNSGNDGEADTLRYNWQNENFLADDPIHLKSPNGTEETAVNRGHVSLNTQATYKEGFSQADHGECTCEVHEGNTWTPRKILFKEISTEDDIAIEEKEEGLLNGTPKTHVGAFETQTGFTRFLSYYASHESQRERLSYPHLPYHCCSSRAFYALNDNAFRYHEPAFIMNSIYHYSAHPRILPNQNPHTSQGSTRNQGFKCDYCGKVYCRKYVLKIHMRTHTGFKPLRCKVCDKSFSDPSNMKKHVKLHESEDTIHKCRYCGRNFVRYRGLLNHIKSKHAEHFSIAGTI
ncbi:histone-lysine N-methyltransferase PRDM9-like isoform X2 [Montipora capricornis]|uniref:histone-lysine N-methyltransferase PRDM9-like isoform X2 n=1 Tax=Montipora capricornis TaxID=246305 RepID=UPI0035F14C7C